MTIEVWDGAAWNNIKTYSSFDNAGEGWGYGFNSDSYDISAYASNRLFKIRFIAHGEDSFEINDWYLDNIEVKAMPSVVDAPVSQIAVNSTEVALTWAAVSDADWYAVYAATDADGTYNYLGWMPRFVNNITLTSDVKGFYRVTGGAGALPSARLANPTAARLSTPQVVPAVRRK
jgi:hypothetical protein